MLCLYYAHVNSALAKNALYTKHTNWERLVVIKRQGVKLPKVSESLPDSVAAVLRTMKLEPSTRAIKELEEQGQVMESWFHAQTLISSLTEKK